MGWTDRVEALDLDLGAGQLKLEGPTRGLGVLSPIVAVFCFVLFFLVVEHSVRFLGLCWIKNPKPNHFTM